MVSKKLAYHKLSDELQERIDEDRKKGLESPYKCSNDMANRRKNDHDIPNLWRPSFVRDIEKILHLPFYNRYADKTQVFSFYNNDDITRRGLHVQLVSRIARNIGSVLGLNLDLIEAIALGHDIGHTPFGHAGERFLNSILYEKTGRYFNHNVHSVRVLDNLFSRNLTLQALDGILCHNGEFAQKEYRPIYDKDFDTFDKQVEACYVDQKAIKQLVPSTLEACVVRICDMIAYLGKDRQDAYAARLIDYNHKFETKTIGATNAEIINNLTVDIIENSYGKDYILLSKEAFTDLKNAKTENYEVIYMNDKINSQYEEIISPMFTELYNVLFKDIIEKNENSIIYKHHISFIANSLKYYDKDKNYANEEPNQIVVDFIASMTDDYFIALHSYLFPTSKYKIKYKGYFEKLT